MGFDYSNGDKPFYSENELLDSFSEILDLHIFYLYKYHSWVGPDNTLQGMLGVVVTRAEFERNLLRASDSRCMISLTKDELAELSELREYFFRRWELTESIGVELPALRLARVFSFDWFELFCVLTLLCCEVNQKYEKLFSYIQDDIARKTPTAETLIRLFGEPLDRISDYFRYFSADAVLTRFMLFSDGSGIGSAPLRLSSKALDFLTGGGFTDAADLWSCTEPLHPLYADKDTAECAFGSLKQTVSGKTSLAVFSGVRGSGRRFQVKHCGAALGEDILFADISELFQGDNMDEAEERLTTVLCERILKGCALCLTGLEYLLDEERQDRLTRFSAFLRKNQKWLGSRVYMTSTQKWTDARLGENIVKLDFELPETDEASRLALWEAFTADMQLDSDISPEEMAAKFRFSPGQIKAAASRAADLTQMSGGRTVSADTLHECCYAQVVEGLNSLASPIKPAYSWEDLVLPPQEVKLLKEACTHVRYRHQVYGSWGFGKRAAYGRGLSVLFSGPPGTGKTMAAQVITNQLHMRMYKIQISQIVSKYIGETEKNLRQVFTEARQANCILFFDEMDALFGKRSEVKDSHDRNANIETAYLLQQLEEYDGVVLMATNLLQNIDEAFMRRINFVVSFPFPDVPTRRRLWQKMLDTSAPKDENIDYDFLAENFKIAGGNIKNCAVHAAFLAAAEGAPISMKHLVSSVVTEQRKNNIIVVREDLKEYADLVFE
ncbi:MAG: ATP-binding protein [Oscillospiraceae bacterium]